MAKDDLVFPRLIYRGAPDHLGAGNVGETKRVNSQDELDEALKEDWRLTRDDGKPVPVDPGTITIPEQAIDVDPDSVTANRADRTAAQQDRDADAATKARGVRATKADQASAEMKSATNAADQKPPARNALKK